MRWAGLPAVLCAACLAEAAEPPPPKASDVLKPPGERQIASPITDRFALRATFFAASVRTDLRLDSRNGVIFGTELSAENELGMRRHDDQGRIELTLRTRERHRLRFDYFKLTRSGDAVLTRNIHFGNQTFLLSDQVLSLLDWRTFGFTYLYSVFHDPRFELGAGFGIHVLDGQIRALVPTRQAREDESGVVPFPSLAADATWVVSRWFSLSGQLDYLSADVDKSSGLLADWHIDGQYRWTRNIAIGMGYASMRTHADVGNGSLPGRFNFDVKGPELFLRASF